VEKHNKPRHKGGIAGLSGICRNQDGEVLVEADGKILVKSREKKTAWFCFSGLMRCCVSPAPDYRFRQTIAVIAPAGQPWRSFSANTVPASARVTEFATMIGQAPKTRP
jgi:hypothetical protein